MKAFNEDTNLDTSVSIASPFGTAMSVGSTCGVITGTLMAIGALKGRNSSEEKTIQENYQEKLLIKLKKNMEY